ncbi:MAG: sugar transferase [Cyclobacteriaceae bacterium]
MDWVLALMLSIMLAPLILVISLIISLTGKPVLFRQLRPGFGGAPFEIYKFTSLNDNGEPYPFGVFLRKTSLDEIPQLFNILKGDMSFIGPRPLLLEYLDQYSTEEHQRHSVRPGISGWAQVNGRKILTLESKLKYDLEYVENVSGYFDLKILVLTFWQLVKWAESDEPQKKVEMVTNES